MASSYPGCHLVWRVIAGIGQVESDHGRYGGARCCRRHDRAHIVGPALNGAARSPRSPTPTTACYDGDTVWDRAVGPMQFIPSTWAVHGRRR